MVDDLAMRVLPSRRQPFSQLVQQIAVADPHADTQTVSNERNSIRPTQAVDFCHSSRGFSISWYHAKDSQFPPVPRAQPTQSRTLANKNTTRHRASAGCFQLCENRV